MMGGLSSETRRSNPSGNLLNYILYKTGKRKGFFTARRDTGERLVEEGSGGDPGGGPRADRGETGYA